MKITLTEQNIRTLTPHRYRVEVVDVRKEVATKEEVDQESPPNL